MKPGVISKGVNHHHKAWNSVRKAKHGTKEDLKTFPCTMTEVCQKPPVVFEIDPEKNGDTEHELPVLTVTYREKPVAVIAPPTQKEKKALEELSSFDDAWKDIEQTLQKTEPKFKGWREATEWMRNRT